MSDFNFDAQKLILKALIDSAPVYFVDDGPDSEYWYFCIDKFRAFAIPDKEMFLLVEYDGTDLGSAKCTTSLVKVAKEAASGARFDFDHIEYTSDLKHELVVLTNRSDTLTVFLDNKWLKVFGKPQELEYRCTTPVAPVGIYKNNYMLGFILPVRLERE